MKTYIKPQIEISKITTEFHLLGSSTEGGSLDGPNVLSKGHNSFFESWDSYDEEDQQSGFTSKNLWED